MITLSEVSEMYVNRQRARHDSGEIAKSTLNDYENYTENWILSYFGEDYPVEDITEEEVQNFIESKESDYSDSTLRQVRSTLEKIREFPTEQQLAEELSRSREEFQSALDRLDRISNYFG